MEFSDRTIVLRVGGFREADLWVRLLSASRGVFSAFAFGGSKSRKRFSGCLDLFNEVLFQVKGSGQSGYLALQEGVLLRGPERLRHDWRRMGLAVNCSLFIEAFCINPDGSEKTHALFVELLNLLETAEEIPPLLPIFFRARLAFEHGYALNPDSCAACAKIRQTQESAVMVLESGGLLCNNCAPLSGQRLAMGSESLLALRSVVSDPMQDWLAMAASDYGKKECARAIDAFLQHHLGLYWSNGRFVRR